MLLASAVPTDATPTRYTGATSVTSVTGGPGDSTHGLPVRDIESILQADGTVSDDVLSVTISRSDLHIRGGQPQVLFKDGFQIQHELYFESIGHDQAILNGDLAVRPDEIQHVIDAFLAQGITFQAEHQHLYDLSPMVWFLHFRAVGHPLDLARRIHAVITTTSTPLPQSGATHPTTPLPAMHLAKILGGTAEVGDNGVVTVTVDRTDRIRLDGVHISPELGVSTEVQFEPLPNGQAAVVPDFSIATDEVMPVTKVMRAYGWQDGCLYNQETGEDPQLYFSHMFAVGDPITLAHQIRDGLDHTAAQQS